MRQFVRFEDIVKEEELPALGTDARDRFVEVMVTGEGKCRRTRLEWVAPDVARALSEVNSSLVTLAEQIETLRRKRR